MCDRWRLLYGGISRPWGREQVAETGRNGWIARLGPATKIANLTVSPNTENYQVADSGKIARLYCFRIARLVPMAGRRSVGVSVEGAVEEAAEGSVKGP